MQKLFYFAVALLMSSCSYQFLQVGKLSSDNVTMSKDGKFEYSESGITISYDFWSNGGEVLFVITNNTDTDIYLLKDRCYYIKNGMAYDYYKSRSYTKSLATSSSIASTTNIGTDINRNYSFGQLHNFDELRMVDYSGVGVSRNVSKAVSRAYTSSNHIGYAVESNEDKKICIPAHSSKYISDYNLSNTSYRQCGFIRDSKKREGEKISFTNALSSPLNIENRLVFSIGEKMIPIVNKFYVSEYTNILDSDKFAYISVDIKGCNGERVGFSQSSNRIYKHTASNCFYTKYKCKIGKNNDRLDEVTQHLLADELKAGKGAQVGVVKEKEVTVKAKEEAIANAKQIERCIDSNIFSLQHLKIDECTTSYTDLGDQYLYGNGKEFSIELAFLCYNYGAKNGEADSFLRIAQYYETGKSFKEFYVEQDTHKALLFYGKAAVLQVQGASEAIARLQIKR